MWEAYKMITRTLKRQQRRSTASESLSVWVKPKKGMLRNQTNKPRRQRKVEDRRRNWCNVRRRECAEEGEFGVEEGGFGVEVKGAE